MLIYIIFFENYCMMMHYDFLCVTKLHMMQNKKFYKCKMWIANEDAEVNENNRDCLYPATGVGIIYFD